MSQVRQLHVPTVFVRRLLLAGAVMATSALMAWAVWFGPASKHERPAEHGGIPATGTSSTTTLCSQPDSPGLLAEPYARVDPSRDGWDTEAFSDAAAAQLEQLGRLFAAPTKIDADALAVLAMPDIVCGPLRPGGLQEAYADRSLVVLRPGYARPATSQMQHHGLAGLGRVLSDLAAPLADAADVRAKFKIIRVEVNADSARTQAWLQTYGRASSGAIQQNAVWSCRWLRRADNAPPRLISIELEDYEEVVTREIGSSLFADCTEAVLGENACFREQLLTGIDHWRGSVERRLGIGVSGLHGIAIGDVNGDGLDDLYLLPAGRATKSVIRPQNADGTGERSFPPPSGVNWLDSTHGAALLVDLG